jgi:hypothetical protein
MRLKLAFAALFLTAALPACSQVGPAATQGGLPLVVGAGYSNFYTDWSGRESGATLWIDWNVYKVPRILHGIGLEVQGRDLSFSRTGDNPKLRMDVASGGAIYRYNRYRNLHPYAKFLLGFGSIDFTNPPSPYYTHDTRTVLSPGGGVEYRVFRNIWVRGDYEYQFWNDWYHHHDLNPQGFTIGAVYDFRHMHEQ